MKHRSQFNTSGIYSITSTADDRVYVGQAVKIGARWAVHRHHLRRGTHNNRAMQETWDRCGEMAFCFKIEVDLSSVPNEHLADTLYVEECRIFALHERTFNILHPSVHGVVTLPGTRIKLSNARKTAWDRLRAEHPEKVAAFSDKIRDIKSTEEARSTFGEFSRRLWEDPTHRAAQGINSAARWRNPEYRNNIASQVSDAWNDPNGRAARVTGMVVAWTDPGTRARRLIAIQVGQVEAMKDPNGKMRQRPKKRWAASDARDKQSDKTKEQWVDPEKRAHISDAIFGAWSDPTTKAARLAKCAATRARKKAATEAAGTDQQRSE